MLTELLKGDAADLPGAVALVAHGDQVELTSPEPTELMREFWTSAAKP